MNILSIAAIYIVVTTIVLLWSLPPMRMLTRKGGSSILDPKPRLTGSGKWALVEYDLEGECVIAIHKFPSRDCASRFINEWAR